MSMLKLLKSYWADERGATSIEYGLIAALVCSVVIGSMTSVGTNLKLTWNKIANKMS
jgi:pilus assembly protein Flp/PilA